MSAKLVGELGQAGSRLVRATADVTACVLRCSGTTQLIHCQARRNAQAHNSSSPQAPPQTHSTLKVSAAPRSVSIHLAAVGFRFSLSQSRNTQTETPIHANTGVGFKSLRFDALLCSESHALEQGNQ